jgi:hypothetical protein
MSTKKKAEAVQVVTKPVVEKVQNPNSTLVQFYDRTTRQKLETNYRITDPTGKVVCELVISAFTRWNADNKCFDMFFQNIVVNKQFEVDGDFEEAIRFVTAPQVKSKGLWTLAVKADRDKKEKEAITL